MGKRNIYKDMVFFMFGCLLSFVIVSAINFWMQQQKDYVCYIQSETELTEPLAQELKKLEGLYQFTAVSSCNVTLRLEEYCIETAVAGIDVDSYPLKWKSAREEIMLGNTMELFFGEESFCSFTDVYGSPPGKSQIKQWEKDYESLELTALDENGVIHIGKIAGILKKPAQGIYMSRDQMDELFPKLAKTTGGCMKITGSRNLQKAQEILSGAGFQVETEE